MNIIYRNFNQFIHDKYFCNENIGSLVILSVDESVIQEFYREFNLLERDFKSELRYNSFSIWAYALEVIDNIPNMFGLVAMQIYIASVMHKDEEIGYSAQEYNPRLEDLFGISNMQTTYANYQDKIWQRLRIWAESNEFFVKIPRPTSGKGCYIQYPLSQALLNQEDFIYIPIMFEKLGLKVNESLSLYDFESLIKDADQGNYLSAHYYKIKKKLELDNMLDLLYSQIFTFYNNQWNGILTQDIVHLKSFNNYSQNNSHLVVNEDCDNIEVFDDNEICLKTFSLLESGLMDSIKEFYRFYTHLKNKLVFIKDEDFGDWCESRYLVKDKDCLIISKCQWGNVDMVKDLDCNYINYSNNHYSIFKVNINNDLHVNSYWETFFSKQERNVFLENGLKLNRNVWMYSVGPDLIFKKDVHVWLNGKKINLEPHQLIYSLRDGCVGSYMIKEKDQSPIRFEINYPENKFLESDIGWKLSRDKCTWDIEHDNYNLIGLTSYFKNVIEVTNVRKWINSLESTSRVNSDSVVLKAIIRSRYGI